MTSPRFLQIHTLHSYTAALLNRDDSGLAKRITYGDAIRTRISSQCLKRHWRMADDPHAMRNLTGFVPSFRSRELVTKKVIEPLQDHFPADVMAALEPEFQKAVYGDKADKGRQSRQTLLLGDPELSWLATEAQRLASESADDAGVAKELAGQWSKDFKDNIKVMREKTSLPGGLTAALFGRMVTSDPAANIDAPVHVAHSFTVHEEEAEGDYFTAVDDLRQAEKDSGADTIQETELTCGLFYGYVVVDLPGLLKNCGGDRELTASIVGNLGYLIAEVSPGAKLGSTAPYGRADFMLIETGDRQPRSLAGAWRKPVPADLDEALKALAGHLGKLDEIYATGEDRRYFTLGNNELAGIEKNSLHTMTTWAAKKAGACPDA